MLTLYIILDQWFDLLKLLIRLYFFRTFTFMKSGGKALDSLFCYFTSIICFFNPLLSIEPGVLEYTKTLESQKN